MKLLEKIQRKLPNVVRAGTLFLALTTIPTDVQSQEATQSSPLKYEHGERVPVRSILEQKIPAEYLKKLFEQVRAEIAIAVSKEYHTYFLIKKPRGKSAEILQSGPVATANPNIPRDPRKPELGGARTPSVDILIKPSHPGVLRPGERKSGESGEKMYDTTSYSLTGHAIHGSDNFFVLDGVLYVRWDNSHGCVNIPKEDAKHLMDFLKKNKNKFVQVLIVE